MISCTGATASRNYMPALTEAYYRKLPILAVTSCRDIAWVGQNSPQQIDRSVQPKDIVRYSLHLPTLHNKQEEDRYTTLINKAILELSKDGGGPVHINLTNGYTGKYTTKELPKVRVIQRISKFDSFPTLPKGKIGILLVLILYGRRSFLMQLKSFADLIMQWYYVIIYQTITETMKCFIIL